MINIVEVRNTIWLKKYQDEMEEIGELATIQGKLDYFPTNHTIPVSQFNDKENLISVTQL